MREQQQAKEKLVFPKELDYCSWLEKFNKPNENLLVFPSPRNLRQYSVFRDTEKGL